MAYRTLLFALLIFYGGAQVLGLNTPALAAPRLRVCSSHKPKPITFFTPIAAADTIQVHEVVYEAQKSEMGLGSLVKTATLTICLQSAHHPSNHWDGSRYRVDMQESNPPEPASYLISDGKDESIYKRGKLLAHETAAEVNEDRWFDPLSELQETLFVYRTKHTRDAITAVLARREGKQVLVAGDQFSDHEWYDPKTHLPIRRFYTIPQFGALHEYYRVEYSRWVLNAPLPASTFVIPPGEKTE